MYEPCLVDITCFLIQEYANVARLKIDFSCQPTQSLFCPAVTAEATKPTAAIVPKHPHMNNAT